jgi:hypothetical protein
MSEGNVGKLSPEIASNFVISKIGGIIVRDVRGYVYCCESV